MEIIYHELLIAGATSESVGLVILIYKVPGIKHQDGIH